MSKIYIYSTLTNDQQYVNYKTDVSGVPKPESSILIRGGANLMTKTFITPRGAVTEVTAEQLAELKRNEVFNLHCANGYITISEAKADAEVVAADMTGRDESAPIVEQDGEIPAPVSEEVVVETPRRGRPRKNFRG